MSRKSVLVLFLAAIVVAQCFPIYGQGARDPKPWLGMNLTGPADYVRNIRVIMPGFEKMYEDDPWHPVFLNRWKGVACLRFMDFMHTNGSTIGTWSVSAAARISRSSRSCCTEPIAEVHGDDALGPQARSVRRVARRRSFETKVITGFYEANVNGR